MSEMSTFTPDIKKFRFTVLLFACLLGALAAWILTAELLRPEAVDFPTDDQSAALIYAHRDSAAMAGRIGVVRGDLWTQAAFAYGDLLWNRENHLTDGDTKAFERARTAALRALVYAPHDARLWILLAAMNARFDWLNDRASADLRMSFYTGSNMISLVPARLLLSMQTQSLQVNDFQELVRHDLRIAAIRKSELMPAVIAAYNSAPVAGQLFMEKTLAEFDPSMLKAIHSNQPHH